MIHSAINTDRLLSRFLSYVQIDTTANPHASEYPSSSGQLELGRLLVQELLEMGLSDAVQDEHGLVWATVPATVESAPTILFNAHLDTSPESPGANVRPRVVRDYQGGDIPLQHNGEVIRESDCTALLNLLGHTLVITDGSTLLGGDDKAGVAAIMELAHYLVEHPEVPHGPVRVLFTCDEEVGHGALHMNLDRAAADAAYTLDGSGRAEVEAENFSADQISIQAIGNNIHPSIGKGRMVNALRGLAMLIAELPLDSLSPESTEGMEGFLHPYSISGGVAKAKADILLRDFDTQKLEQYAQLVAERADDVAGRIPGLRFEINRQAQYRNMADAIRKSPQVVDYALAAYRKMGLDPTEGKIRGGTDGAQFSAMGLPTPNLAVGQHNIHSVREFVSVDEMVSAVQHAIELLVLWGKA